MPKGKYDLVLTDDEGDAPQTAPAPAQSAPPPAPTPPTPSSQPTTQQSPPAEPTTIPDPPPKQKAPCTEAQLRALEAGRKKKQEMMAAKKAQPPPPPPSQEEDEEYEADEEEEYEPTPPPRPRARKPAALSYQQLYYKAKLDRLMQAEQQQQQLAQYQQAPMEKHMEDIARNTIRKKLQEDVKRRAYVSLFGSEPPALF